MFFDGDNDLVLEDKGPHSLDHPPENECNGQVLHPGKLQELPEPRVVGEEGLRRGWGISSRWVWMWVGVGVGVGVCMCV